MFITAFVLAASLYGTPVAWDPGDGEGGAKHCATICSAYGQYWPWTCEGGGGIGYDEQQAQRWIDEQRETVFCYNKKVSDVSQVCQCSAY